MTIDTYPRLRLIDMQPINQGGRTAIMLTDPLLVSDKALLVPQQLAPLLVLCDGTRDISALRAALAVRFGTPLTQDALERALSALDEALFFDNQRFAQAHAEALAAYRSAPYRPSPLGGQSYPEDPDTLRRFLDAALEGVDGSQPADSSATGRGVISPHIDYHRGASVYAAVWKQARDMARAADLVIIFGTDHHGGEGAIIPTRQHYATPLGILPTNQKIVDAVAAALGSGDPESPLADELHHRSEHSIELAAVWLQHIRQGKHCSVVPILCGSFARYVRGEADPAQDPTFQALLDTLQTQMAGHQTLVVAAADLSHIGPAFGGQLVSLTGRAQLQEHDDRIIQRICAGDAAGFMAAMQETGDRYNVCGLPPIYLTLRLLGDARGTRIAYDRCPADAQDTSWVSVCGVILE